MLEDYNATEKDLFDRQALAQRIAIEIDNTKSSKGFSFGILGKWGKGKTILLELIKKELRDNNKSTIIEFNPWLFSDNRDLINLFFSEIQKSLKKDDFDKEALEALENYAKDLSLDKDLDYVRNYSSTVVMLVTLFMSSELIKIFSHGTTVDEYIISAGLIFFCIIILFQFNIVGIVNHCNEIGLKLLHKFDQSKSISSSEKPISELRNILAEKLSALEKNIVILIDDLDRLEKHEILQIFKLIKNTADFPKIIYIIALDEKIVESKLKLDFDLNDKAKSQIKIVDKFIQAPIYIPDNLDADIYDFLVENLEKEVFSKLSIKNVEDFWDKEEFSKFFFNNSICQTIESLRDAKRLINSLIISLSLMECEGALEVNINDFIILEIVKVFYNSAYEFISINANKIVYHGFNAGLISDSLKQEAIGTVNIIYSSSFDDESIEGKIIEEFKAEFEDEKLQYQLARIFSYLFPGERKIKSLDHKYSKLLRGNKISCLDHVNKYFCLSTLESRQYLHSLKEPKLLTRDLRSIFSKSDQYNELEMKCNELCEKVGWFNFLLKFRSSLGGYIWSVCQSNNIIKWLFNKLESKSSSIFMIDKEFRNFEEEIFSILSYFIVDNNMQETLFSQKSLYGIAWFLEYHLFEEYMRGSLRERKSYRNDLIEILKKHRKENTLFAHNKVADILILWYRIAPDNEVQEVIYIIHEYINISSDHLFFILSSRLLFMGVSISHENRSEEKWEIRADALKQLGLNSNLYEKLNEILISKSDTLTDEEKNFISLLDILALTTH